MKRSWTTELSARERATLESNAADCTDAALRTRYLIVLRSAEGWTRPQIARALSCSCTLVSRVRARWAVEGEAGLVDRREDNGDRKVTEHFGATVRAMLEHPSLAFGWRRPTWTLRMLVETARRITGVTVSRTSMSRLLARIGARRGRPKPLAPCGWSERARNRRMKLLHALIATLPPDEALVWEDETDIDLNPRIGPDWMLPRTQRTVMTPGKNVKRYLALALDEGTGRVMWVRGRKKDSGLFIGMLKRLLRSYPTQRVIHVILDNYGIHSSRRTNAWLRQFGERLRLHFLPPYCPDDNRIEREVIRELHANVTYNHDHVWIESLLTDVVDHLHRRNRAATRHTVTESRKAI